MKKKTKAKKGKQKQNFNDLLIPVLGVLCVMPLLIHLITYDSGLDQYTWYAQDGLRTDIFSYWKSYFFMITVVFMLVILILRMVLYKNQTKSMHLFLPLGVYGITAVLSSILSIHKETAWQGNLSSFEGIIVLLGYLLLGVYVYQVVTEDNDYHVLWKGFLFIWFVLTSLSLLQIFQIDLYDYAWVQKLFMSETDYAQYGGQIHHTFQGSYVYATLDNPNYAGVYFVMAFFLLLNMGMTERNNKRKGFYLAASFLTLIVIWFTYSRSTLASIVVGCVILLLLRKNGLSRKDIGKMIGIVLVIVLVLVGLDGIQDFHYLRRMIDTVDTEPLERLITDEQGVHLCYAGDEFQFVFEKDRLLIISHEETISITENETFTLPLEDPVVISQITLHPERAFSMEIADVMMRFAEQDGMYYYETIYGKREQMQEISHVDFHGLENLGSGRLYIWSRTLPLLLKRVLVGSGPDTFAEVFPQNDYAGKAVYSNDMIYLIEKGHNDYLTKWIQTGGISVIAYLVFLFLFLKKGFTYFKNNTNQEFSIRLGCSAFLGCVSYMTGSVFNDSTVQTTPLFWILTGLVLSVCAKKSKK